MVNPNTTNPRNDTNPKRMILQHFSTSLWERMTDTQEGSSSPQGEPQGKAEHI
jgi:hypothetical protein